jgi:HSP20 family protein
MNRRELTPGKWRRLTRLDTDDSLMRASREMEALHRDMDRLFEGLWGGPIAGQSSPGLLSRVEHMPELDVSEDDKAFHVNVELPGMEEKDVEVTLSDRILSIKGEKKEEKETKEKDYHRRERSYGIFRRRIEIPGDVDANKIEAAFKKGVLNINLPKSKESQERTKRIVVKT